MGKKKKLKGASYTREAYDKFYGPIPRGHDDFHYGRIVWEKSLDVGAGAYDRSHPDNIQYNYVNAAHFVRFNNSYRQEIEHTLAKQSPRNIKVKI